MTASPYRPRSQNTATSPNSARLRPENGTSRVDDSHLRTLPPTLFRLRNLKVPRSAGFASVALESETNSHEMEYASTPEAMEAIPTKAANPSQNETRDKESREIASNASTQRSLVSQLSSQSLVLFVILAIAITGIVIGNRGGEQVAETDSSLKESFLADSDSVDVDLGTASEAVVSDDVVLADDDAGPSSPSATKHADLASATPSKSLDSNAIVQTQVANVADAESGPSGIDAEMRNSGDLSENAVASAALPASDSQDSATTDLVQQKTVNPAQVNLGTPTSLASGNSEFAASPAVSSEDAQVANVVAATGRVPASNGSSGYVQTQTPAGVNDWLRYLPNINAEVAQPGTVAVSDTPLSPIASYQQYLDSMSPGSTQATAPVGYLQDAYGSYPNDAVGTQAQLPVSTSSTQRR